MRRLEALDDRADARADEVARVGVAAVRVAHRREGPRALEHARAGGFTRARAAADEERAQGLGLLLLVDALRGFDGAVLGVGRGDGRERVLARSCRGVGRCVLRSDDRVLRFEELGDLGHRGEAALQ